MYSAFNDAHHCKAASQKKIVSTLQLRPFYSIRGDYVKVIYNVMKYLFQINAVILKNHEKIVSWFPQKSNWFSTSVIVLQYLLFIYLLYFLFFVFSIIILICYADDTQLYLSFHPDDPTIAARISACLTDISCCWRTITFNSTLPRQNCLWFHQTHRSSQFHHPVRHINLNSFKNSQTETLELWLMISWLS